MATNNHNPLSAFPMPMKKSMSSLLPEPECEWDYKYSAKEGPWESLDEHRQIKKMAEGKIVVVAPKDFKETTVPLFCGLCEFPMKTREDGLSYRRCKVCEKCEMRWKNDLMGGFEKIMDTDKWDEYYDERVKLSSTIINLE